MVHYWLVRPARQQAPATQPGRQAQQQDYAPSDDPGQLTRDPLAGLGKYLKDPPAGAIVPAGARFLFALELAEQTISASYLAEESVAAAADFYRTAMPQAGFTLRREKPDAKGAGSVQLTFINGSRAYTVILMPADKEGRSTRISLVYGPSRAGG